MRLYQGFSHHYSARSFSCLQSLVSTWMNIAVSMCIVLQWSYEKKVINKGWYGNDENQTDFYKRKEAVK